MDDPKAIWKSLTKHQRWVMARANEWIAKGERAFSDEPYVWDRGTCERLAGLGLMVERRGQFVGTGHVLTDLGRAVLATRPAAGRGSSA